MPVLIFMHSTLKIFQIYEQLTVLKSTCPEDFRNVLGCYICWIIGWDVKVKWAPFKWTSYKFVNFFWTTFIVIESSPCISWTHFVFPNPNGILQDMPEALLSSTLSTQGRYINPSWASDVRHVSSRDRKENCCITSGNINLAHVMLCWYP